MVNKILLVGRLTAPAKVMDEPARTLFQVRTQSPAMEGWEGLCQDHELEWRGRSAARFSHYLCTGAEVYVEGQLYAYDDPEPCLCSRGHRRFLVRVQKLLITGGTKARGVGRVWRDGPPRKD